MIVVITWINVNHVMSHSDWTWKRAMWLDSSSSQNQNHLLTHESLETSPSQGMNSGRSHASNGDCLSEGALEKFLGIIICTKTDFMVENIILSIFQNTILSYAIKQNIWEKQFGRNRGTIYGTARTNQRPGRPGKCSSRPFWIFCNLLQPKIGNLEAESMSHTLWVIYEYDGATGS